MNITTNTKNDNITISGEYTLDELIHYLSRVYPDFNWKNLVTRSTIDLHSPPLPVMDDLPF